MANSDKGRHHMHGDREYAESLSLGNRLTEPAVRAAIRALRIPPGSRGLDAGCGIGSQTLWLAEAVSPGGHVTGVDISAGHLAHAREMAAGSDLAGQVAFRQGDVNHIPFDDDSFDWVWSADTLWIGPEGSGCPAEEPLPLVKELLRVVRPGGTVAVLFWSSKRVLPGYPLLEARLDATYAANSPWTERMKPEFHSLRALGWLREAGVEDPGVRTFASDIRAPLDRETRLALKMVFEMFWDQAEPEVSPEDWAQYQRLCRPDSPGFILDVADYYAFITHSLFYGRVPG